MALKRLGVDFECWKTSEWDVNSCKSYKAVHFSEDTNDYSAKLDKEQLIQELLKFGVSVDGKKPMEEKSIRRKGEKWLRETYNCFKATHNLGSITDVHAEDLEIDEENYTTIMFYSFPCQDLSLAGKQAGMDEGSGTRSSLLWEVSRILKECKEQDCLPMILTMENVTQVCGKKNIDNWNKWLSTLEEFGYHNYYKNLNAKNFGIAQNRDRTFCVSILSDKLYIFPDEIELNKRLKDYLEPRVDENYYINTEKAAKLIADLIGRGVLKDKTTAIEMNGICNHKMDVNGKPIDVAHTLMARDWKGPASYVFNGAIEQVPVDMTTNNPQERDVANCIIARCNSGITNFAQDGIGVVENV